MHLEASHESFMWGIVLGKATENMAVTGNSETISEWVSNMTLIQRKRMEHFGKISVSRVEEQVGRVHRCCLQKSPGDGTCSAGSLTQEGAILSAQISSGYTLILLPWSEVKGLTGEAINSTELRVSNWLVASGAAQEQEEVDFLSVVWRYGGFWVTAHTQHIRVMTAET